MKKLIGILMVMFTFQACQENKEVSSIDSENWDKRTVDYQLKDSLEIGSTYLSVYSQIYSQTEHKKHDLTATVSLRNTSKSDTLFIDKAEYFDTHGKLLRNYFAKTIFIIPMETVEIVIHETDQQGGTGANFMFDWKINSQSSEPLFEGVMISTSGQQGLSFTTQGKRVN